MSPVFRGAQRGLCGWLSALRLAQRTKAEEDNELDTIAGMGLGHSWCGRRLKLRQARNAAHGEDAGSEHR